MSEHPQALRGRYGKAVRWNRREEAEALAAQIGVTPSQLEQHFLATQEWVDEDPPAPFEAFSAIAPGRFDPRVFDQATWWVDILRIPHRITDRDDFPDAYLVNILCFVLTEAWRWAKWDDDEFAADALVDVDWFVRESMARIERTPLIVALRAEAVRRGVPLPLPPRDGGKHDRCRTGR